MAYNVNNQLTQWGTANLYYDADGNMTSDGVNNFVWDARNQLTSVNFGATASFKYDAYGRRVSKTTGSTTTNYLYDGVSIVQELSGTTPTANLLSGGIDEVFMRTDANGPASFITDAQGSTLALTDVTGTLQTEYAYEPFGNTTITGGSGSPFQYTGREDDDDSLYFFRARYFSPIVGRFISEDPEGIAGGLNLYSYSGDDPINFRDPLGLCITRGDLAISGLLDLAVGGLQLAIPILLAPETGGLSLLASYQSYSGGMKAFGGIAKLLGAATGDVENGEEGGQFFGGLSTASGTLTLLGGGSFETAETASSIEGLVFGTILGSIGATAPDEITDLTSPNVGESFSRWVPFKKIIDYGDTAGAAYGLAQPPANSRTKCQCSH
ncbi:MAG TPA: RHS repeat-associated core domain-containing protein [Candidatus Sulfotelmatobacter sp.]|nr:RHS repeat-associated core domain-containing protein [Candidatus Sulfotelmatobacter sp.]